MHHRKRRYFMQALAISCALPVSQWANSSVAYPPVRPRKLVFPRDHGAHPEFRTEWWYLTGYADTGTANKPHLIGFQITFFRSVKQANSDKCRNQKRKGRMKT